MKGISRKTKYVATSGWRGYTEPINAVAGANDTGTWSDSPCPSHEVDKEIRKLRSALKKAKIRQASMTTSSSNVFCVHRYILVDPENKERAKEVLRPIIEDTDYAYLV